MRYGGRQQGGRHRDEVGEEQRLAGERFGAGETLAGAVRHRGADQRQCQIHALQPDRLGQRFQTLGQPADELPVDGAFERRVRDAGAYAALVAELRGDLQAALPALGAQLGGLGGDQGGEQPAQILPAVADQLCQDGFGTPLAPGHHGVEQTGA